MKMQLINPLHSSDKQNTYFSKDSNLLTDPKTFCLSNI